MKFTFTAALLSASTLAAWDANWGSAAPAAVALQN